MKSKDLYRWADHRATMLWVSLKCLVFLTVGVSIVVAVGDLQAGHQLRYQSLLLESDFFSGSQRSARSSILQPCETTWTTTSKEARSAQTLRRHHSLSISY